MSRRLYFLIFIGLLLALLGFSIGRSVQTKQEVSKNPQLTTVPTTIPSATQSPTTEPEPTPYRNFMGHADVFGSTTGEQARVIKVIDGDTVQLDNGKTLRYIGIDTPETRDPRKGVQCFGKEATAKNKELVEAKVVRLEKDVSETDKYGRLLRYVHIGDMFVNEQLVRQGFAYASSYPPDVKYQALLNDAQVKSRNENLGLWAVCGTNPPLRSSVETKDKERGSVSGDKDCKDFKTQQEAQDFFISQGGQSLDPHKLDQDKDGVVCESLP